jgi:hypothetical protein
VSVGIVSSLIASGAGALLLLTLLILSTAGASVLYTRFDSASLSRVSGVKGQ